MTRSAPLLSGLATFLVAALLSVVAAPIAAAIPAASMSCCGEHCPPPEAPSEAATCCLQAPPASHDAATVPASPAVPDALLALVTVQPTPSATLRAAPPPRDTGPPPSLRRHLTLSVLLV